MEIKVDVREVLILNISKQIKEGEDLLEKTTMLLVTESFEGNDEERKRMLVAACSDLIDKLAELNTLREIVDVVLPKGSCHMVPISELNKITKEIRESLGMTPFGDDEIKK